MKMKEIIEYINNRNKKAKEIFNKAKRILPLQGLKITKVRYGYAYVDIPFAYILDLRTNKRFILDMYDLKALTDQIEYERQDRE